MRTIITFRRVGTSVAALGLFITMLVIAGCTTVNCPDCGQGCGAEGPGDCQVTQLTQSDGTCNAGTSKCSSEGGLCLGIKHCRTLGAPNCYCSCR